MRLRCSNHEEKDAVAAARKGGSYRLMCKLCKGMWGLTDNLHKSVLQNPRWEGREALEKAREYMEGEREKEVPLEDPELLEWLRVREVMED